MANPPAYYPNYSFSGWQAANPSKPLPAPQVDNELANISTSLNLTIDALEDIRRSDGQLQNGIVGVDALSPGISPGFVLRGQWAAGVNYIAADSVVYAGKFYRANVAHLSTNANRPDLDSATWTFLYSTLDLAGAMSVATYDPNGVAANVFDRANHTGTQAIATVTGLQTALNGKAALVHTHAIADVTGLQTALDGKNPLIHSATLKGTLDEADDIGGADSASSYAPIRFTLVNLRSSIFKTTVKIPNAYFDSSFRLWDAAAPTKGLSFDLTGITAGQTRKIIMPDNDVNLGSLGLTLLGEATPSGTTIDFTSLPSTLKHLVLVFDELNISGGASMVVRLGTSGGFVATGYTSIGTTPAAAGTSVQTDTTGMTITVTDGAAPYKGIAHFYRVNGTDWVHSSSVSPQSVARVQLGNGRIALGATLTQLRLTTIAGSITFSGTKLSLFGE